VSSKVNARFKGGSRVALACVAAALVAVPTAAASLDKGKPKHHKKPKPKVTAVGAVYTESNDPTANTLIAFNRSVKGTLTLRARVATGGKGTTQAVGCGPGCPVLDSQNEVVQSTDGRLVFAVNGGSNTVSSFTVSNKGIKLVGQYPSGGTTPENLALHGNILYVLNVATQNANGTTGNIYGWRVASNGTLTPLGSSQPLANPAPPDRSGDPRAMDIDPTGKVIVVTELAGGFNKGGPPGKIDTFLLGSDGKAGAAVAYPSQDAFPFGFAFDHNGHLIVSNIHDPSATAGSGSVSSYNLNTSTGAITPINTVQTGAVAPCWVEVAKNGQSAFVVNTGAGAPALITTVSIAANGALSVAAQTPSQTGEFARTDESLSRDGKFLYVLSPQIGPGAPSHIDAYRVGAGNALALIGATPAGANLGIGAGGLSAR
jgi:lactonase family protein with 7-bladed beta-propeller